jgi:stringent starvation protein B
MMSLLPPKKEVALALLERASVFVHLDPRAQGVRVPPWLKRQPQLVLQIGLNLAVNIPDLAVEDDAVSCTLSFSRRPHFCWVPWESVYALVGEDGRGMVWPSDIPAEVAAQTQSGQALDGNTRRPKSSRAPSLVALEGSKARDSSPQGSARAESANASSSGRHGTHPTGRAGASHTAADRKVADRAVVDRTMASRSSAQRGHLRLVK